MGMGASSAEEIVSSHFISRTKACFSFIFPEGIICQTTKKKVVASLVSGQTEWKKSGCWRFSPPSSSLLFLLSHSIISAHHFGIFLPLPHPGGGRGIYIYGKPVSKKGKGGEGGVQIRKCIGTCVRRGILLCLGSPPFPLCYVNVSN